MGEDKCVCPTPGTSDSTFNQFCKVHPVVTSNNGKNWTAEDEKALVDWLRRQVGIWEAYKAVPSIAKQLGRTEGACIGRLTQIARNYDEFKRAALILGLNV